MRALYHRMKNLCLCLGLLAMCSMSSPLHAQTVQVTSANPSSTMQGTTLDVIVGGNGFKKGAQAQWFLTGTTNPGGVTVNSTAFNSSSQLTANITVSSSANTGSFDVQVKNVNGSTGKGTGLFTVSSSSGQGAAACASYSVTSILYDTDSNSVPLQYQSDGLGPYTTFSTKGNKDSVNSVIQGSCSWALNTTSSTSRGIVVTLAHPDSTDPPPPFVGPQEVHGVFRDLCTDNPANNNLSFGSMTFVGQTLACPVWLSFDFNGASYRLAMDPQTWAGSSWMQVKCSGASSGQCNSWSVLPDPATAVVDTATNQVSAVAELIATPCLSCSGGTGQGLYLVSFSFLIHK